MKRKEETVKERNKMKSTEAHKWHKWNIIYYNLIWRPPKELYGGRQIDR